MKFSIVTPCCDRTDFLEETITSVLSQTGNFSIQYVIQDASEGNSVSRIVSDWNHRLNAREFNPPCKKVSLEYVNEPDDGMYDGINKAFSRCTGDIMAWINSDDLYHPYAFQAVAQAFAQHKSVDWIVGQASCINRHGNVVRNGYDPKAFSRKFIQLGYYRGDLPHFACALQAGLNWLPQDSVFWRRQLWLDAGPLCAEKKLVADFLLWQSFAKFSELVKIETQIGSYRYHGNQLTASPSDYPRELGAPPKIPLRLFTFLLISRLSPKLARALIAGRLGKLSRILFGVSRRDLMGKRIIWKFSDENWSILETPIVDRELF